MKLTTSGLCLAAAFAFAASLGAQTTTSSATRSSNEEVSITGCLERAPSGSGFVLNNARMENESRSGATTGTTGTTSGTTSTTTSGTSGTTYGNMSATGASTWSLSGDSSELEKHVGHKVQVTGSEKDHAGMSGSTTTTTGSTTTSGTTGTSGTASSTHESTASRTLDVKSLKMISTSCS